MRRLVAAFRFRPGVSILQVSAAGSTLCITASMGNPGHERQLASRSDVAGITSIILGAARAVGALDGMQGLSLMEFDIWLLE
jgi:hypothetical protein